MVHSCIFNDLCVGKHFANVCDVPFSWPFLSRAVPICYAAVNGWSGFWHGVIIAGVERTPDGFCAHAGHSLFDVCNVVFRIFFGIEHASQRLDAHVFTDFQHYEIANTDEVCQWFPELIGVIPPSITAQSTDIFLVASIRATTAPPKEQP